MSQAWIKKVAVREEKEYILGDADGEVRLLHKGNYRSASPIIDNAQRYLQDGKTIMFLASCSYMLEPLKPCPETSWASVSQRL
jgi:hypothetical protein